MPGAAFPRDKTHDGSVANETAIAQRVFAIYRSKNWRKKEKEDELLTSS
jgi:hypothetical protein